MRVAGDWFRSLGATELRTSQIAVVKLLLKRKADLIDPKARYRLWRLAALGQPLEECLWMLVGSYSVVILRANPFFCPHRRPRRVRTSKKHGVLSKCTCPWSWLSSCNAQLSNLCFECYNIIIIIIIININIITSTSSTSSKSSKSSTSPTSSTLNPKP